MCGAKIDVRDTQFDLVDLYNSHPTYTMHTQTYTIFIYNIINIVINIIY